MSEVMLHGIHHCKLKVFAASVLCDVLRVISGSLEDLLRVLEVLHVLCGDTEAAVRTGVVGQLIPIALSLSANKFNLRVVDNLLPIILDFLTDSLPEVRNAAQSALLNLLEQNLVSAEDIESQGSSIVEKLCLITEKEDLHPEVVSLVSKLLPLVAQDCKISLLCHFITICDAGGFAIRNACAASINVFCGAYESGIVRKFLLPKFCELCKDDVWRVRKSCADNFIDVARSCSHNERIKLLLPIFLKLLHDDSPWVSRAAYSSLGPFISIFGEEVCDEAPSCMAEKFDCDVKVLCSFNEGLDAVEQSYNSFNYWRVGHVELETNSIDFLNLIGQSDGSLGSGEDGVLSSVDLIPPCSVPPILVAHYLEMAGDESRNLLTECAYSFPAVVSTLGRHNWPLLKDLYVKLAVDSKLETRVSLACSLHEVALILGSDLVTNDVQPIFCLFIQDADVVKIGLLKHLSEYLKVLDCEQRQIYLKWLGELRIRNPYNWRLRLELCVQIGNLIDLYTVDDVLTGLLPTAGEMIVDKVAVVRRQACITMCQIFSRMLKESTSTEVSGVLNDLSAQMCAQGNYLHKQTYVHLCGLLVRNSGLSRDQFSQTILPQLVTMAHDKVANVRLVVAQTLRAIQKTSAYLEGDGDPDIVQDVLTRLSTDPDPDVQFFACHAM